MTGDSGSWRQAVHILEREQLIPLPLERTFAFFSRAENLEAITPPWLKFRLITKIPIEMKRGTIIEYNLRINGFPVYWRTLIAEYDPPHRFVDVQQKGPYKLWRHEHTFEAVDDGTLMRDRVEYQIGYGILGEIARRLFVERQLRQIWYYRERRLSEILREEIAQS